MLHIDVSPEKINTDTSSGGSAANSVAGWFAYIAPDFTQSNVSTIAGAKKLVAAKKELPKRDGSFPRLVEKLGLDLGKAERLMKIAKHPVLSNSAHAPIMPLCWTTLYALSALPPRKLEEYIADGSVHPGLERKEAERLVRKARGQNSTSGSDDGDWAEEDCEQRGAGGSDGGGDHPDISEDVREEPAETGNDISISRDVGPDSPGEIERKMARLDELERERRQWEIQRAGYESEVEELRAKLGPEVSLRHPRKLFRRALETLQKSDAPKLLEKDRRALVNSAVTDLIELIRSLARDGLALERLDLFCRPEVH